MQRTGVEREDQASVQARARHAADTGNPLHAGLLGLQRTAGNQATAALVQRDSLASIVRVLDRAIANLRNPAPSAGRPASWTSDPAPAPGGVLAIRAHQGGTQHAAGVTDVPGPPPPSLDLQTSQGRDGRWRAAVRAPAPLDVRPRSLFPAPGLHDLPDNPHRPGVPQKNHVTPEVSVLVRRGEEEHLDDIHWALQLTYGTIIATLTRLAGQEPPTAATEGEARQATLRWINDALPRQLRFTGDDPFRTWVGAYTSLVAVTYDRDRTRRWHSLPRTMVSDPAELRALGLQPAQADVYRTLPGGEIGQHDPETLVRARFDSL